MYPKIMGLDVGEKRIGIALSDPLRITAQGLESYQVRGEEADFAYLKALCDKHGIEKIVCGLPKNMDGSIGPQAEKILAFAQKLQQAMQREVILEDERLTTVLAQRTLLEADVSRAKRRKVVDKLAAVAILQGYLDRTKL